jgi:ABC-type bacteriocin/lantibiotic exporter with double-glycine peptidase domain
MHHKRVKVMSKFTLRQLYKQFSLQKDQSDCGVVCLQSILRFHGADESLEHLRELSGTSKQGTTMLGLYQAANGLDFQAEGAEAEGIHNLLEEVTQPCILHLTLDNRLLHYVVYYPAELIKSKKDADCIFIGDPAKGIIQYDKNRLEKEWVTKACLLLTPTDAFHKHANQQKKKWDWFWPIVKEDINLLYIAAILGLTIAILQMSSAIFLQQLVDKILPAGENRKFYIGIGLLLFLLLLKSGLQFVRQLLVLRQAVQFNMRLNENFFSRLLHLGKSFFDNRKTGDLVARLNDSLRIQQAVSYIIGEIGIQLVLIFVAISFIFFYTWQIGLLCLLVIPFVFGIVKKFQHQIVSRQKNLMIAQAQNESNYIDTIKGIAIIKALNKETVFLTRFQHIFSFFQTSFFSLGKTRMQFFVWFDIGSVFFLTSVIFWSSLCVWNKTLQTGEMFAIVQMAGLLFQNTIAVALTNIQLQEARVAFDRIYEFTSLDSEFQSTDRERPAYDFQTLEVKGLSFRFPGKQDFLQEISFTITKGEIIAIIGESGEGKSTIFQILQRFYAKENGIILYNGVDCDKIELREWRKKIGIVPQESAMFSGTLLENICLENNIDKEKADDIINFCSQHGLDKYFEQFPQGYFTVLGEGGINISGGQKQLVGFARCLYHRPQVILLDEPTSAMDTNTEAFVTSILNSIKHRHGIILISHKDSLASIANKIYILNKGILIPFRLQID